jgi:hypothetical protein
MRYTPNLCAGSLDSQSAYLFRQCPQQWDLDLLVIEMHRATDHIREQKELVMAAYLLKESILIVYM